MNIVVILLTIATANALDVGVLESDSNSIAYWTDATCRGKEVEGTLVAKELSAIALRVHLNSSFDDLVSISPADILYKAAKDSEFDPKALYENGVIGDYPGVGVVRDHPNSYCVVFPALRCNMSTLCEFSVTSFIHYNTNRRRVSSATTTNTTNRLMIVAYHHIPDGSGPHTLRNIMLVSAATLTFIWAVFRHAKISTPSVL